MRPVEDREDAPESSRGDASAGPDPQTLRLWAEAVSFERETVETGRQYIELTRRYVEQFRNQKSELRRQLISDV